MGKKGKRKNRRTPGQSWKQWQAASPTTSTPAPKKHHAPSNADSGLNNTKKRIPLGNLGTTLLQNASQKVYTSPESDPEGYPPLSPVEVAAPSPRPPLRSRRSPNQCKATTPNTINESYAAAATPASSNQSVFARPIQRRDTVRPKIMTGMPVTQLDFGRRGSSSANSNFQRHQRQALAFPPHGHCHQFHQHHYHRQQQQHYNRRPLLEINTTNNDPKQLALITPLAAATAQPTLPSLFSMEWFIKHGLNKNKNELTWNDGPIPQTRHTIQNKANQILNLNHRIVDCKRLLLGEMLPSMLARLGLKEVEKEVESASIDDNESASINTEIIDNIRSFVEHHETKGARTKEAQDAVLAVASAVAFHKNEPSLGTLPETIGISPKFLKQGRSVANDMMESGAIFCAPCRKNQSNNMLPFWKQFVRDEFCHNDDFSWFDSFGKSVQVEEETIVEMDGGGYKVSKVEKKQHQRQMWDQAETIDELFALFEQSEPYKKLLANSPKLKPIFRTTFFTSLCRCVVRPEPKQCVNEIVQEQVWNQLAILKGMRSEALKNLEQKCQGRP